MGWRAKLMLVAYLTLWTTVSAWAGVKLFLAMNPDLGTVPISRMLVDAAPKIAPIFAFLLAAYASARLSRSLSGGALLKYFVLTPIYIYLVVLLMISLMSLIWAPVTFVVGFFLGFPALILGILVHCLGMAPLWFFQRTLFSDWAQRA